MRVLATVSGLFMGFGLIIAIGAQNVFVLRQGIRREHIALVIAICAVSDVVLILAGVGSLGAVVERAPWLTEAVTWGGAAFLAVYGVLAARRAFARDARGLEVPDGAGAADDEAREAGARADGGASDSTTAEVPTLALREPAAPASRNRALPVALTALALTWLNPHVYLDTVFLLGSVAATHGEERWLFALGASIASLVWFTALGVGARWLGRYLRTPRAWRVLDGVIAVIMFALAVSLVVG